MLVLLGGLCVASGYGMGTERNGHRRDGPLDQGPGRQPGQTLFEVERAIREGAPKQRPHESRDWAEYARRVAEHAFGVSGERDVNRLTGRLDDLLGLEGRRPDREQSLDTRPPAGLLIGPVVARLSPGTSP